MDMSISKYRPVALPSKSKQPEVTNEENDNSYDSNKYGVTFYMDENGSTYSKPVHILNATPEEEAAWNQEHRINLQGTGKSLDDAVEILQARNVSTTRRFNPIAQSQHPSMSQTNQKIAEQAEATFKDYYSGKITSEEVGKIFLELARENFEGNIKNNFAIGNDPYENKEMLKSFYTEFRRSAISAAVKANGLEGQELVGVNYPHQWKYYNSDYSERCDELIQNLNEHADILAKEFGESNFKVPDYSDTKMGMYHDFESSWNSQFEMNQYMLDKTQKVPSGVKWLFKEETGGGGYLSVSVKDENGVPHQKEIDIPFEYTPNDIHRISDFFQFDSEDTPNFEQVNRSLSNFQIFSSVGMLLYLRGNNSTFSQYC